MYRFLVFLHVGSAFLFMLAHGASAAVMYRLRSERDPAALRALFSVRDAADLPFSLSAGVMILSGIALAFVGRWWRAGWIWASLGVFVLITILMSILGRAYFEKARALLEGGTDDPSAVDQAFNSEDLPNHLESGRPMFLAVTGIGGFLAIVWLMMFKPF